jgi:hypothetical protein
MHPVLRPFVDRRHLLTLGATLSIATFASTAIWPRSGASQSGLVEGYADGDGVRLYFVQGGRGPAHVVPSRRPRHWDALHEPARGVLGPKAVIIQCWNESPFGVLVSYDEVTDKLGLSRIDHELALFAWRNGA